MSEPSVVLAGIVVIGIGYVLLPVAVDAFLRYRGKRPVRCPQTGARAEVELDARAAALAAMFTHPDPRVGRCSEWPQRKGCQQGCVSELGQPAHPAPARG